MSEQCTCGEVFDNDECQCSLANSDCLTVNGSGRTNPFTVVTRFDPHEDNLASCADGLLVEAPDWLTNPPRAQAYHNAAQSIPNDDGTLISLNSEYFDTDTMHDAVTNNSRLTFNTAGIYVITFGGEFASNATGDRQAVLRRNGVDFFAGEEKKAVNGTTTCLRVIAADYFREDEYVEVFVKQDSGGALNLTATRYSPVLTAVFRRPPPT